ncbi:MAG: ATP-binding protein [Desulfuromonas sp.]|jgi:two-component system phosphate regulon sensor histidine kinase PhoR|nr:ATP-binding protein [Desulfuromonas sp.]
MRSFAKVFLVLFVPIFIALVLTFYFSYGMMMSNARNELLQEMKNKWIILALQSGDLSRVTRKSHEILTDITRQTSLRVTLVNCSGKVLLDSLVPFDQISKMENHKGRQEIKDAIYSGDGFSSRFSSTTDMQMFYFAKTLANDQILRLAYPATYVKSLQNKFTEQAVWALFYLSFVVLLLALYFARKVSLPVQKLNYIADNIEAGKTNVHFPHFKDPSMAKIAGLIYRIYAGMQKQNLELAREQQKLSHIFTSMDQGVLLLDKEDIILHANSWLEKEFGTKFTTGSSLFYATNDIHLINFFSEILKQNQESVRISLHQNVFDVSIKHVAEQRLLLLRNVTKLIEYEAFKAELTGNISHELKTPLAMIMGYAETLRDTPNIDKVTRSRFIDNIYCSTVRLNRLINDIIELHRLESVGDGFAVDEAISLGDITDEIRSFYADTSGKTLTLESKDAEAWILQEHLQSILTNLIDNAIKYSEGEHVTARIQSSVGRLTIMVDDQGPLIARAEMQRIFERFYTCSQSRNKHHSGTGLGLSIVKHIAKLYNGTVRVEANSEGGNRFLVVLAEKN